MQVQRPASCLHFRRRPAFRLPVWALQVAMQVADGAALTLPLSALLLTCVPDPRCGSAPLDHVPLNRISTMRKRFRSGGPPAGCCAPRPWEVQRPKLGSSRVETGPGDPDVRWQGVGRGGGGGRANRLMGHEYSNLQGGPVTLICRGALPPAPQPGCQVASQSFFPQERPGPREGRGGAVRRGPLHGVHQGLAPGR